MHLLNRVMLSMMPSELLKSCEEGVGGGRGRRENKGGPGAGFVSAFIVVTICIPWMQRISL